MTGSWNELLKKGKNSLTQGLAQFLPTLRAQSWLRPQPPLGLGLGVEAVGDPEDIVPGRAQPSFFKPQPWNVCGPISRVSEGSPRALIFLQ